MAKVIPFEPVILVKDDVCDTLVEAADCAFEEVLVLGRRDGQLHMMHSGFESKLEIVGALEMLKVWLIERS